MEPFSKAVFVTMVDWHIGASNKTIRGVFVVKYESKIIVKL
jgi:hypothetical protein